MTKMQKLLLVQLYNHDQLGIILVIQTEQDEQTIRDLQNPMTYLLQHPRQ